MALEPRNKIGFALYFTRAPFGERFEGVLLCMKDNSVLPPYVSLAAVGHASANAKFGAIVGSSSGSAGLRSNISIKDIRVKIGCKGWEFLKC